MPDYGVDTPDWSPLDWSWAAERLRDNRNFWVVTATRDGRPHAMPVWGVWDDPELRFMFTAGPRARKVRNLAQNPRAVVAVDDTIECISLEGVAAPVDDQDRRAWWIDRYLPKYQPISPELDAQFLLDNLMIEFVPERAFAIIEREAEFATRATKWVFDGGP